MEKLKLQTVVNLLISLGIDFLIALVIKYSMFLAMSVNVNVLGVFIMVVAISFLVNMSWRKE